VPNWSQLSGVVERLITAALMYAVGRGWILSSDVAPLVALGLAAVSAGYAVVVNRNTNLAKQAGSIPNTTVVTTPEIAAATPQQPNIVSNADVKVVTK
jgi:hypothetical protein